MPLRNFFKTERSHQTHNGITYMYKESPIYLNEPNVWSSWKGREIEGTNNLDRAKAIKLSITRVPRFPMRGMDVIGRGQLARRMRMGVN